jgi:hypothetical protein
MTLPQSGRPLLLGRRRTPTSPASHCAPKLSTAVLSLSVSSSAPSPSLPCSIWPPDSPHWRCLNAPPPDLVADEAPATKWSRACAHLARART